MNTTGMYCSNIKMFWASICTSSGEQCSELPHMMCSTVIVGCGRVELGCQMCALCESCSTRFEQPPHSTHIWQPNFTRRQPTIPVLHIICCSSLHCSPDDGHIDSRN